MNKEAVDRYNAFRQVCLKNSEDLLAGAASLLEKRLDHLAFHLTVLALEEIGKLQLVGMQSMGSERRPDKGMNLDIEDHEKKLFWAIWGPSFGHQKITKDQIEKQQGLARNIHARRKAYLYADPANPVFGQEKMRPGEAQSLYEFVEVLFKLASVSGGMRTDASDGGDDDLTWFLNATNDLQRRKEIFGHESQDKLIEFGDVKGWIKWLRKTYELQEQTMRDLAQSELQRERPEGEEAYEPKWRIRVKLITPSHSIRNSPLSKFNEHSDYIKLRRSDQHTLIMEILMPKGLPVGGLWQHGWGHCRIFVTALNIGARGIFWWNVPVDTAAFYEEIWDLEKNAEVRIELNPRLQLDWSAMRMTLGQEELRLTGLAFGYVSHLWIEEKVEPLNHYVSGLSFFAKNDVHLRLELNAFEEFYRSLRTALVMNGDWDGKSDLKDAIHQQLAYLFGKDTATMDQMLDLAAEAEQKHLASRQITITDVIAMKNYCDAYFIKLAKEHAEKRSGKELNFILKRRETGAQQETVAAGRVAGPDPESSASTVEGFDGAVSSSVS